MAKQTSSNRIRSYSKVLSKNCRKQSIFIIIICGISVFLQLFQFMTFGNLGNGMFGADLYDYGFKFSFAGALAGVILVAPAFKELHNRQYADVEFSLPMSASERFFSKLYLILKAHIIPYLISQVLIIIGAGIFLKSVNLETVTCDVLSNIVCLFFTDATALFCVACCGSLLESIYTPVFAAVSASFIIPIAYEKFVYVLSNRTTEGAAFDRLYMGYGFITKTYFSESTYYKLSAKLILMLVLNLIVCAGIIFLAYLVYKKRNGLSVGKPFVFNKFFICFITLVTLFVILLFYMHSFYLAIFVGLLINVAIYVSSKRKKLTLRGFELDLLGFCGCLFAVLVVGFAAYVTGGFGYINSGVSDSLDTPRTKCMLDIYSGKYYYRVVLLDQNSKNEGSYKDLPEYRFATKERMDTLFKTVASYDKRKKRSLLENLADYIDVVVYESQNDGYRYQETLGICEITCYENTKYYDETVYDNYYVKLDQNEIIPALQKFSDLGFSVLRVKVEVNEYGEAEPQEYWFKPGDKITE